MKRFRKLFSFTSILCFHRLNDIVEEHKNNEKSNKIISSARNAVVKEIVMLEQALKGIQNESITFVEESIEGVGVFEYATIFCNGFQRISSSMQNFVEKVSHPVPIIFYGKPTESKYLPNN